MAVCRVEKNKNYTTMSNYHLRDPNLSNKARGLLSTMLSLPDNWDYTTRGLAKICKDGVDGITAQLKELEQYGYLIRNRIRDSGGRIVDMEYIIYERPHTASPDTEKPDMVKPDMDLPRLETPAQINIDQRITDESNTDLSNTHSILSDKARPSVLAALEAKRKEAEYRDMEVREDDEEYKNPVDRMFEELEAEKPNHFAVRQYKKYSLAAGKTAKSILVSCGARLAPFDIAELREITMYDELELDTLGDKIFINPKNKKDKRYYKTALFLIMSDTDSTFNFLISMIYTQLFNLLCEKADDVYGGRLPVHVRCLIDEAANIGQIPNLEKLVATIRSREISACLVLQAQSQLKALYKDNADTIIGNMDSRIFLGGSEPTTLKELNQSLGKETIDTFNTGESRGREVSHSLNYQKLGKDLATIDELAVLDGGKCILQLRGVRPFMSNKYDITRHPNYKYLSDANPKNNFDIAKYLSTQLKTKPDDVYQVYEVDASDVSATA